MSHEKIEYSKDHPQCLVVIAVVQAGNGVRHTFSDPHRVKSLYKCTK